MEAPQEPTVESVVEVVAAAEATVDEGKATEPAPAAAVEADADAVEEEPTVVAVEGHVADTGEIRVLCSIPP